MSSEAMPGDEPSALIVEQQDDETYLFRRRGDSESGAPFVSANIYRHTAGAVLRVGPTMRETADPESDEYTIRERVGPQVGALEVNTAKLPDPELMHMIEILAAAQLQISEIGQQG